jgi:hypothetical protein
MIVPIIISFMLCAFLWSIAAAFFYVILYGSFLSIYFFEWTPEQRRLHCPDGLIAELFKLR